MLRHFLFSPYYKRFDCRGTTTIPTTDRWYLRQCYGHYYGPGRQQQQQSPTPLHKTLGWVTSWETVACQLKDNTSLTRLDFAQNPHIGVIAWEAVAKVCRNVQITQTCLFDTVPAVMTVPIPVVWLHCLAQMEMDWTLAAAYSSPLRQSTKRYSWPPYLNRLGIHELCKKSNHRDWINCMTQTNHPTTGHAAERQSRQTLETSTLSRWTMATDARALLSLNASYTFCD
jgi:hypothetical protein